jgi:hypothetical protein
MEFHNSLSGKLGVIDWTSGQCINYFKVCFRQRVCFAFDRTNTLITGDSNKTLKIWDFSITSGDFITKQQEMETKLNSNKQCMIM